MCADYLSFSHGVKDEKLGKRWNPLLQAVYNILIIIISTKNIPNVIG